MVSALLLSLESYFFPTLLLCRQRRPRLRGLTFFGCPAVIFRDFLDELWLRLAASFPPHLTSSGCTLRVVSSHCGFGCFVSFSSQIDFNRVISSGISCVAPRGFCLRSIV